MDKWNEMRNAASGRPDLVAAWVDGVNKAQTAESEWIKNLRIEGYKAAHPNDGWVNREENKIHLAYPQFNDGLQVGDKMMLGWASGNERPIRITGIEKGLLDYYLFEDLT